MVVRVCGNFVPTDITQAMPNYKMSTETSYKEQFPFKKATKNPKATFKDGEHVDVPLYYLSLPHFAARGEAGEVRQYLSVR